MKELMLLRLLLITHLCVSVLVWSNWIFKKNLPTIPNMGFANAPFRNSENRKQIILGCENQNREMHWTNYYDLNMQELPGPQSRFLIYLTNFIPVRGASTREGYQKIATHTLCKGGTLVDIAGCNKESKKVGLQLLSYATGESILRGEWPCPN